MGTSTLDAHDLSMQSKANLEFRAYLASDQRPPKDGHHINWLVVLFDGDLPSNLSLCWRKEK